MYCKECGKKLRKNDTYCSECGCKVEEENTTITNQVQNNNQKTTNEYGEKQYIKGMTNDTAICVLSLILMYGVPVIRMILGLLSMIPLVGIVVGIVNILLAFAPIAAIVLVIYARIHYKESRFAKILLIVYIVQIVLSIVLVIVAIFTCVNIIDNCEGLEMIAPLMFR